jgi:hypothetical protein
LAPSSVSSRSGSSAGSSAQWWATQTARSRLGLARGNRHRQRQRLQAGSTSAIGVSASTHTAGKEGARQCEPQPPPGPGCSGGGRGYRRDDELAVAPQTDSTRTATESRAASPLRPVALDEHGQARGRRRTVRLDPSPRVAGNLPRAPSAGGVRRRSRGRQSPHRRPCRRARHRRSPR